MANWLLQLLKLRWAPDEAEEKALLRCLLRGDLGALPEYGKALKNAGLDAKAINEMASLIRRLVRLRTPA